MYVERPAIRRVVVDQEHRGDALVREVVIQPLREAFGFVLELRDDHQFGVLGGHRRCERCEEKPHRRTGNLFQSEGQQRADNYDRDDSKQ